ncbi:RecX family transcriptional regulator [Vibrio breoganii]|uniref:RecX family transcriptional regulator n=1 Tax=Vibrio breoganii TaxID=553239 RepID=UPI000C83F319|nr:RecX family transcriptional regulator [Vibrio breoganii]PMG92252.1 recombinase A [Vibrio breoganii]
MNSDSNKPRKATRIESVMNSAMWHLTQRDMTESELLTKLKAKTDNQEWIDQTLESLRGYGYLKSDSVFAEQFAERSFSSEYGSNYIVEKLKRKGIGEHTIVSAIDTVKKRLEIDELAILLERLNNQYQEFTISREKLVNSLLKRGFTYQQVQTAISQHPHVGTLRSNLEIKAEKADLEKEVLKYVRKGKGLTVIRQELKQRKIDISDLDTFIEQAINSGEIDFFTSCLEQLHKKSYDLNDFKKRSKAYAMLSRKGFSSEEIKFALSDGEE